VNSKLHFGECPLSHGLADLVLGKHFFRDRHGGGGKEGSMYEFSWARTRCSGVNSPQIIHLVSARYQIVYHGLLPNS
jgi:hypothetical protein